MRITGPAPILLHVVGFSSDHHPHLPSKETEAQENEVIWAGSHRGEGEGSLSFFIVFFPPFKTISLFGFLSSQ